MTPKSELVVQIRAPRMMGIKAEALRMMARIGVPVNIEAMIADFERGYRWRIGDGKWQPLPARRDTETPR